MYKLLYDNDLKRQIAPKGICNKCEKKMWVEQSEPLVWSCFYCGNLVYYKYGRMEQQIDTIRRSRPVDN